MVLRSVRVNNPQHDFRSARLSSTCHRLVGHRSSIAFMISSAQRTASRDCADRRRNPLPAIKLGELAGSEDVCRD